MRPSLAPVDDRPSASARGERLGGIAGLLFAPVLLVGFFFDVPEIRDATPEAEIAAMLIEYGDGIRINLVLQLAATVLFILFAAGLRARLRRAEGPGGVLPEVAFGGAVAGLGLTTLSVGFQGALVETAPGSGAPLLAGLVRLVDGVDTVAALFFGLAMVAASLAAVRTAALPRWLGCLGLLGGLVYGGSAANVADISPLGLVGFLGFFLYLVWTIAVGLALLRGAADRHRAADGIVVLRDAGGGTAPAAG